MKQLFYFRIDKYGKVVVYLVKSDVSSTSFAFGYDNYFDALRAGENYLAEMNLRLEPSPQASQCSGEDRTIDCEPH
jgi:hypothetical protein